MKICPWCGQEVDYVANGKCGDCMRIYNSLRRTERRPIVYAHFSVTPGRIAVIPLMGGDVRPTSSTPELSVQIRERVKA